MASASTASCFLSGYWCEGESGYRCELVRLNVSEGKKGLMSDIYRTSIVTTCISSLLLAFNESEFVANTSH